MAFGETLTKLILKNEVLIQEKIIEYYIFLILTLYIHIYMLSLEENE
jgi:hypothetical protein